VDKASLQRMFNTKELLQFKLKVAGCSTALKIQ
jgi:hypothetical protein